MPDISMCTGENCPLKEKCYRFKAKPSSYQAFFSDPPVTNGECEYFWPEKPKAKKKPARKKR